MVPLLPRRVLRYPNEIFLAPTRAKLKGYSKCAGSRSLTRFERSGEAGVTHRTPMRPFGLYLRVDQGKWALADLLKGGSGECSGRLLGAVYGVLDAEATEVSKAEQRFCADDHGEIEPQLND